LSSALRFSGFEPIRPSFADEANEEIALRPRVYADPCVGLGRRGRRLPARPFMRRCQPLTSLA